MRTEFVSPAYVSLSGIVGKMTVTGENFPDPVQVFIRAGECIQEIIVLDNTRNLLTLVNGVSLACFAAGDMADIEVADAATGERAVRVRAVVIVQGPG